MRLLNVKTLQLEEFFVDHTVPRYSILSHRWEDEEVTFRDLSSGRYTHLKGYQKIRGCCKVSRVEGFKYTWIDTCCIDKSSSSELSEAINSMFQWYKNATVCYAYLSDVWSPSDLSQSKWFTRGWTLQELVAPDAVVFLDAKWHEFGTRVSLTASISAITGIDETILGTLRSQQDITETLRRFSVASKMSWASTRTTTRLEDEAYCLLGLFDINMPLIYGEGRKAFLRLQREIMNGSDDDSIFAWSDSDEQYTGLFSGIIASSPRSFKNMNDITARPGLGIGFPNVLTISKDSVRLHASVFDTIDYLMVDPTGPLSLVRRVSDTQTTLMSIILNDYPEDHTMFDVRICVLGCLTEFGPVVLMLYEQSDGVFGRYHFDGHLYSIQNGIALPPPQDVHALLWKREHPDMIAPFPPVRMVSCVGMLGYRPWATSAAPRRDEEHKHISWFMARGGRGYVLFENRRKPRWPPFMLAYCHEPEDNHFKIYCGVVAEDFMPDDASRAMGDLEFRSSRETSEVRVRLLDKKELVTKLRVTSRCCDLVLLVEDRTTP